MSEYLSLIKNSNNELIFSPNAISVGWGGCINSSGKRLMVSGNVNFRILRTALNRASALGIESEIINGRNSVLLFGTENGIGKGIVIKLRDKFLDSIISYIRTLYIENMSRRQITDRLNKCCAIAAEICSKGECRISATDSMAESDFINSLMDICHSFGFEPVSAEIANYSED